MKNLESEPPNMTLFNMYIEYEADNITEVLAKTPNNGNLSKVPYKHINSPKKLKVKGAPALAKHNMKKKIENIGII